MIRRLFNLALVIVLAPLFYAFINEGVVFLASVFSFAAVKWLLLGAGLSLVVSGVLYLVSGGFVQHLVHELEHAVVGFLFSFRLPTRMEIDPEKGSKTFLTSRGGCIMVLAPYYFPLFTIPLLLLKALATLAFSWLEVAFPSLLSAVLDLLIGATLMFHYVCSVAEFRLSQDDIKRTGWIASIVGVLFLNFMFLVLSIAVVTGSFAGLLAYGKAALATTVETYKVALAFVRTRGLPALRDLLQDVRDRI